MGGGYSPWEVGASVCPQVIILASGFQAGVSSESVINKQPSEFCNIA